MRNLRVCSSEELENGGDGVEFDIIHDDEVLPAFAVRFRDVVYAYVNQCSHMELKLNFVNDNFFDVEKSKLICATHGALYDPRNGGCLGGPCHGAGLIPIPVKELDGAVVLADNGMNILMNGET